MFVYRVGWIAKLSGKGIVTPQNVISTAKCNTNAKCNNIDAKCNKVFNAKCNNFSMQNVITFLTQNVITQNVITFEWHVWPFKISIS